MRIVDAMGLGTEDMVGDSFEDAEKVFLPKTLNEIKRGGYRLDQSSRAIIHNEGTTAVVFKAVEYSSGRKVAIKIYKNPSSTYRVAGQAKPVSIMRLFDNEKTMLFKLRFNQVVPDYYHSVDGLTESGERRALPFIVMEYIEGTPVTQFAEQSLKSDPHSPDERVQNLLALFEDLLKTVDTIHRYGMAHRDVSDANILVDRDERLRIVDLALATDNPDEARFDDTVLYGGGQKEAPNQLEDRPGFPEDIQKTCAVGYTIFTGRKIDEQQEDIDCWRRYLIKSGTPSEIAKIIAKGLRQRDRNLKRDPKVWHTIGEVLTEIQNYRLKLKKQQQRRLANKRFQRRFIAALFIVPFLIAAIWLGWNQWQSQAVLWNLNQLEKERTTLAEIPQRSDERVQRMVDEAANLEQQAQSLRQERQPAAASKKITESSERIRTAIQLAESLQKVSPFVEPFGILLANENWNTECRAIQNRLQTLQQDYLNEIKRQVETGDPDTAWDLSVELLAKIVELSKANQNSIQIGELASQLDNNRRGIAQGLSEREEYEQISRQIKQARKDYHAGKWPEAKTLLLAQSQRYRAFLDIHETDSMRASRIAANVDTVNDQLAANESLQDEIESLKTQLTESKIEYEKLDKKNNGFVVDAARFRSERDTAKQKLQNIHEQFVSLQQDFNKQKVQLVSLKSEIGNKDNNTAADQELRTEIDTVKARLVTAQSELNSFKEKHSQELLNNAKETEAMVSKQFKDRVSSLEIQLGTFERKNGELSDSLEAELENNTKLRKLAGLTRELDSASLEIEIQKKQVDLEREKRRQELTSKLNSSEYRDLMDPFFDRSLARVTANLAGFAGEPTRYNAIKSNFGIVELPMSIETIQSSHALEKTPKGLKQLVALAQVNGDSRDDWNYPTNAKDWERVQKAQDLLNEYKVELVELGHLRKTYSEE